MKFVLCHGVFDLLHAGHLEHLEQAKKMGDYLVVSVLADKFVTKGRLIYNQEHRMRLVEALRCVDKVTLCNAPGPQELIKLWLPDLYVRGPDYRGKVMPESAVLKKLGIKVRYTSEGPMRTSKAIEMARA